MNNTVRITAIEDALQFIENECLPSPLKSKLLQDLTETAVYLRTQELRETKLREVLTKSETTLREYHRWIMTNDLDMRGDSPDESLEPVAEALAVAMDEK